MRKKVLPKERDSELNSAIQNMIDGGVPSEDIDIFVSDFVNKYGVEDNTEKKKPTPTPIQPQNQSLLSTATSGAFGNTQSPKQNTPTEQSNGQSPQRGINLLRGKSIKPIDVQGKVEDKKRDNQDIISYASSKLADIYARGDESEKERLVPIIQSGLNDGYDKGRSVRKEYNDVYDFYENKKIDEDFIKNATQNDIIQNVNSKSEALKNSPQELAIYQTTKEAKVGEYINKVQNGEKLGDREDKYFKQNAPMAYKQMLKDVEQFSTDFPIQNINTVAEINKKRNDATAQIKGGESLKQSVQAFANVIPEDMLGMGVINSKLQGIKDSYASELKKLEEQYPIETYNVKTSDGFDARPKERPQEYFEAKQELEQKRDELLGMAGRMESVYYGKKNPNASDVELGKKLVEVQSPTMYSLYRNARNSKSFEADLAKMGIDVMLSSGDPNLIAKGQEYKRTFNDRYPEWAERDLQRKIGIEYFKKEGVNTISNPNAISVKEADKLVDQFSDDEMKVYSKMRDRLMKETGFTGDRANWAKIPIPNAGGLVNSLVEGAFMPIAGTYNLLANISETDQQKAQRALTPQSIASEKAFEKDRINSEIEELLKKDKLNITEAKKLSELYTQEALKTDMQRFGDGSMIVAGQVLSQGGVGRLLGAGTSALVGGTSSTLKGLGYLAKAERVAELASNMNAMSNFGSGTFAFLSSYDDASLEIERIAPDANPLFKSAYATTIGLLNAGTEHIFKDVRIFDVFRREVAPEIASLVTNLSTRSITEEVFRRSVSIILKNKLPKYLGNVIKEDVKEGIEEATTEGGKVITQLAGVALGQIDPSQVNIEESIEAVGQVFKQTVTDGLFVAGVMGRVESLRSRTTQRALYELATNQQQLDGFIDAINIQQQSGKMSVEDATDKIKTARTLNEVATQTIPALEKRITLDDNQKVALTSLLTLEKKLENDLANPKNSGIKSVIESQLADVRNKKDGILKGEYIVDENFNALTPDELKQKVAEEKQQEEELKKSISKVNTNPSFVIIEETDGTFSVLIDNEKKEEGFKTKEEASQRVLKLNGIQFEDAPKSTRKVTEKDGITIEMPYNKITEEGGVTYEEPSTTTPNKVVEKDGISIELPASQEDLQTTQNTPQNEETIEATNTEVATNIGQQPSNAPIQEEDTKDATQSEISIHQSVQGVMNGMPITIQRKDDGDYIYTILGAKTPFTKEQHDELVESKEVIVTKGKETKVEQKPISPSGENGNVEQTPTQKENGGEVTTTTNIPIQPKGDSKGEAKEGTRDKVQPSTETISTTTTDESTSVLDRGNPALKDIESTTKALDGKGSEKLIPLFDVLGEVQNSEYNKQQAIDVINTEIDILPDDISNAKDKERKEQLQKRLDYLSDAKNKEKEIEKLFKELEKDSSERLSNSNKKVSEAYHKAKADGSNPELVKAVESLLSKEQTPKTDINDFQYVIDKANKAEGGVKGSGTKKINLSDRETAILNKTIEKLEAKAVANNGASFDPNETINIQYEKINGKEQKINTYTVDGYSIKYKYNSGKSMTEITTPQGDLLIVSKQYGKTEIAYLGKSESLLSKEQPKAETPKQNIKQNEKQQQPKTKSTDATKQQTPNTETSGDNQEGSGEVAKKQDRRGKTPKSKRKIKNPTLLSALKVDTAGNPYWHVLQYFINKGTYSAELLTEIYGKSKRGGNDLSGQKTILPEGEKRARIEFLNKKSFKTVDSLAEKLSEDYLSSNNILEGDDTNDSRAFRELLEDAINSFGSRMEMADFILEQVNQEYDSYIGEYDDIQKEYGGFADEAIDYLSNLSDEQLLEIDKDMDAFFEANPIEMDTELDIESQGKDTPKLSAGKTPTKTITKKAFDKLLKTLKKAFPNVDVFFDEKTLKSKLLENGVDFTKFLSVWHGSPYNFDKFTTEKMGTGEGAQAFGWGLYFTDLESIAKNYAEKLAKSKMTIITDGKEIDLDSDKFTNAEEIAYVTLEVDYTIEKAIKRLEYNQSKRPNEDNLKAIDILKRTKVEGNRNLYKVSIHKGRTLDKYNWLEWDKPVSREVLEKIPLQERKRVLGFNDEKVNKEVKEYIKKNGFKNKQVVSINEIEGFYKKLGYEGDRLERMVNNRKKSGKKYFAFVLEESEVTPSESFDTIGEANEYLNGYLISKNEYLLVRNSESISEITTKIKNGDVKGELLNDKITGEELYKRLMNFDDSLEGLTDIGFPSSKQASLFLLENGIDGIKYPAESISRGATSDTARGFNYVVFDENAITIEEKIQFMQTPNGVIYGAKFPDGSVYLNPDTMSAEAPLHEMSHVWESYLPKQWKEGLEIFKDTIGFKKALKEIQDNPAYSNKTPEEQASEALNTLIGRKGEGYYNSGVMLSKFKAWMDKFFKTLGDKIGKALGIKNLQLTPDQKLDIFVNDILGDLLGGEEVVQQNDTQEKGVKFSEEYESSPSFKKWKGGNRLVSESAIQDVKTGEPIVAKVYHGTTNEFYEFDSSVKGSIEGHLGKVNYFTSEYDDASENYLSQGSDITSRVENLKDRVLSDLENEIDDSFEGEAKDEKIRDIISEKYPDFDSSSLDFNMELFEVADRVSSSLLIGGEEKVLDLYVKLNNPIVLGNGSTWFDALEIDETYLEEATQEVADENDISIEEAKEDYEYDIRDRAIEKQGEGNKLVEALEKALDDNGYDSSLASEILGDNYYETEVDLDSIEKRLRKAELYDNYNGELASSQVIADLFKNLGFDGIILTDVSDRFKNMGLNESTSHIHVFDEFKNQIKLADGTNTTFNPDTNDIRFMSIGSNVSKSISKLSELSSKIDNAQTTSEARKAKEDYDNELKKDSKLNFIITNFTSITDQLNKLKLITKKGDC